MAFDLQKYMYLWDGSDPGWVVREHVEDRAELFLVFGTSGPNTAEIQALRQAIPAYGKRPASSFLRELKEVQRLVLGDFESREGRQMRMNCEEAGLLVQEKAYQRSSQLLFNELSRQALLIEDGVEAEAVVAFALENGIQKRESTS